MGENWWIFMKLVVFGCPWGHLLRNIQITCKFHRYFGSPGGPEMRNFFKIGKNLNFRSISWKMTNFIVFSWKTSILVVFRVLSPRGPLKTIGISKEYVGLGEGGPRNRKIGDFHENGWIFFFLVKIGDFHEKSAFSIPEGTGHETHKKPVVFSHFGSPGS